MSALYFSGIQYSRRKCELRHLFTKFSTVLGRRHLRTTSAIWNSKYRV